MILIGMRNSGKTMYAQYLKNKYNFIEYCLDKIFEERQGMSITEYIEKNGWKNFRSEETKIFIDIITKGNF